MNRILVYKATGIPVKRGDVVNTSNGESATVYDWHWPLSPESTGRVMLKFGRLKPFPYYPSVIDAEWRDAKPTVNRIVEVKLTMDDVFDWLVEVKKEFAPEHGGGSQTFCEFAGPDVHRALDVARAMVTLSPGQRSDGGNRDGK